MNLLPILKSYINTNFWSPMIGKCTLIGVYENSFEVKKWDYVYKFLPDGRYNKDGEIMIFPSEENRDWATLDFRSNTSKMALLDLLDTTKLTSFLAKHLAIGDKVRTRDDLIKNSIYGNVRFSGVYTSGQIVNVYTTEPFYTLEFTNYAYSVEMFDLSYILHNNPRLIYLVEQNLDSLRKGTKFDPYTLIPFNFVLVRDKDSGTWEIDFFQKYLGTDSICLTATWKQCIPYNSETQHLVNTNNKPPKKYIYWR